MWYLSGKSSVYEIFFRMRRWSVWNPFFLSWRPASPLWPRRFIHTYIYGRDTSKKSLDQVVLFLREDDETKETGARKKEEEWREAHHVMKDEGGEEVGKLPWFLLDTRACMCPVLISSGIHLQLPKVPLFFFLSPPSYSYSSFMKQSSLSSFLIEDRICVCEATEVTRLGHAVHNGPMGLCCSCWCFLLIGSWTEGNRMVGTYGPHWISPICVIFSYPMSRYLSLPNLA